MCDFENRQVLDELHTTSTPTIKSPQAPISAPSSVSPVLKAAPAPARTTTAASLATNMPSYDDRRISPLRLSPPSTVSTPSLTLPSVPIITSMTRQGDRLLEFQLWHQYISSTSKTLVMNSPASTDIWQKDVPRFALEGRTYLIDAVLSVAALHLRFKNPDDRVMIEASHAYSASTLAEYCRSLNKGITAENADALFLTSCLIAFQATASRLFVKEDGDPSDPTHRRYALPLSWFHAFQGVKTIVATSWQWIRNSATVKVVIDSQPGFMDLNPLGPDSFFGHLLDDLDEELEQEDQAHRAATNQGYFHAVCVLNWAHKNHYAPSALALPSTVSRRYVELVEAKRPRALAILACFFALLKRMDNVWWLDDVARREVMGLVSLFETGSKWWRHLEWPIRIALWDGEADAIPADIWGVERKENPNMPSAETILNHIDLMAKMMDSTQGPQSIESIPVVGDLGGLIPPPLD
ncbi:C6 zinc finger protein [Trichoderma novae-zelandiae]